MRESKQTFIERRLSYHMDILRALHPDAPDNALDFWARDRAEKEYRTGRVYADPTQIEEDVVGVYDPTAQFTAGRAKGLKLRFGPAGPMVSVTSLSFQEGRELAEDLIVFLRARGYWPTEGDVDESIVRSDKDYTLDHPAE